MTISAAPSIKPGASSLLAIATPATGDGAAFAALIAGGAVKTMPALVPANAATAGGQAGAVIGNALPLKAADTNPDILVVQPAAAEVANTLPGAGLPGDGVKLTEPDRAPDILVDPNSAPSAAPNGDRPQATDDAASLRNRSARFRFVNVATAPVVSERPTSEPAGPAAASPEASPSVAPERDADAPASADGAVPLQPDAAPDILIAHVAPAVTPPVADRPPARDDGAPGDIGASIRMTPDKAPAAPVAKRSSSPATPVGRSDGLDGVVPSKPDGGARAAGVAPAKLDTLPDTPVVQGQPPMAAGDDESRAPDALPAGDPDGGVAAVTAPLAQPEITPDILVAQGMPVTATPVGDQAKLREDPADASAVATRIGVARAMTVALAAPAPAAVPASPTVATAIAPVAAPSTPTVADPVAVPPPVIDILPAAVPPSRADAATVSASPDPAVPQSRQTAPERVGRAPLAAGVAPPASIAATATTPSSTPIAAGAIAPAGELFAAAIHAAGRLNADAPGDTAALLAAPTVTAVAATVAPVADTDPSLDLGHPGWPGAMIEHIERLRDAADAVDTRIRLVPDALGGIDVSLRRHDDGVRVTMTADQPATQAMLAEARPQLHAMAEARGIRLSDTATGGATGGPTGGSANGAGGDPSTGNGRPRPAAFTPAAPPRASTTDTPDPADGRVA